jgi:hypothetical protein
MRWASMILVFVVGTPALATDYDTPRSSIQETSYEKLMAQKDRCIDAAKLKFAFDSAQAGRFCECEADVLSRNLTPKELEAIDRRNTKGAVEAGKKDTRTAIEANARIIPERQRICGF